MPIRADMNSATVNKLMPIVHQKSTEYALGSSVSLIRSGLAVLLILLPDTIVHMTMPMVIISTDRYFDRTYRFRKMMMPIIMLAIKEPYRSPIKFSINFNSYRCTGTPRCFTLLTERKIICNGIGILKSNA